MSERIYLSDKEVAHICQISTSTLTRIISHGDCRTQRLLKAKPEKFGKTRRWNKNRLADALEVSAADIDAALEG